MKKILSASGDITKEDLKRLGRNIAVMYGPVLLILLDQIQDGTFDTNILWATGLGITLDFIRRLIREVTTNG